MVYFVYNNHCTCTKYLFRRHIMKDLTINELQKVSGGKITKYPNGVYCDSKKGTCSVNW